MRKIWIIFVLILISQGVYAESEISGWILVPSVVKVGSYSIEAKDISVTDWDVLTIIRGPKLYKEYLISVGSEVQADRFYITYKNVIAGEQIYALTKIKFPYLLEGQSISINGYQILLRSVSKDKVLLRIYNEKESKDLTVRKGSTEKFGNLRISAIPEPTIFDGFLAKNKTYIIGDWKIRFLTYKITENNGNITEEAEIEINNVRFKVTKNQTVTFRDGYLVVDDLIGEEYIKARLIIKGAYLNIKVFPDYQFSLKEGKIARVGPYLIKVEKIFGDSVYLSLLNPCGKVIKSDVLSLKNVGASLYYNGLTLGILNITKETSVEMVAFLDDKRIPKIEEYALLNVTFLVPENVNQYQQFGGYIELKNEGKVDLKFLQIIPSIPQEFEIVDKYTSFVEELKVGKSVKIPIRLKALKEGSLYAGQVKVIAYAPFELACNGFQKLEFTSNKAWIKVEGYKPKYAVIIKAQDGEVGERIKVNVTVKNFSNFEAPFMLRIAVPREFGIYSEDFMSVNKNWLYINETLPVNGTKTYKFVIFPNKPGKFTIEGSLSSMGMFFQNSTIFTVYSKKPANSQSNSQLKPLLNTTNNTTCEPQIIEKTETIKVPQIVEQNVTFVPLKSKVLFGGTGFIGGVTFILLLAYIAAKLEERKK